MRVCVCVCVFVSDCVRACARVSGRLRSMSILLLVSRNEKTREDAPFFDLRCHVQSTPFSSPFFHPFVRHCHLNKFEMLCMMLKISVTRFEHAMSVCVHTRSLFPARTLTYHV